MTDSDTRVTSEPPCSTFDRPPPRVRDPDPDDLDRLAASLDYLTVCCCEPGTDEADQHSTVEAMGVDEQLQVDAPAIAGE